MPKKDTAISNDTYDTRPKYRRPLNKDQLDVLRLLYRFRFATSVQMAQFFDRKSNKHIQKRLKILEDQEVIGKRYDSTYKLRGKPAGYYLTPKGARVLRTSTEYHIDEIVIKRLYKNKTVSEDFIERCATIFAAYLQLRVLYGDRLRLWTQSQLASYTYFPEWMPDAYVRLLSASGSKTLSHYFLDVTDSTTPFFVCVRKVRNYLTYARGGDWKVGAGIAFPSVLIICDTPRNEKKLRRQIRKALNESYEEVEYITTTMDAFLNSAMGEDEIWRKNDNDNEMQRLIKESVNP